MTILRSGLKCAVVATATALTLADASANCPTPEATGATAKYIAVYNQYPDDARSSWRFYVRPRDGACLAPAKTGYQSPKDTPGQNNGSKKNAPIHDGAHNCKADYKSYISVDVPSAQAVYNTFTTYKTSGGQPQPTIIGWSVENTKAKGPTYDGAIFVVPAKNADGTLSNTKVRIAGVCIQ